MTDTREVMEMAQQPVAYLAWRDGKPCYEGEDVVCADPVWPVDSDDDRTSMPVYAGAAPAAQPDARKVIEQMAGALENAVPTNWSNSSTDEHRNAIQAGQKWLEENMAGDGGPHAIESAHSITGGAG